MLVSIPASAQDSGDVEAEVPDAPVPPAKDPGSVNPYATPAGIEHYAGATGTTKDLTATPVTFDLLFNRTWEELRENIAKWVIIGAIGMGVGIAINTVSQVTTSVAQALGGEVAMIMSVLFVQFVAFFINVYFTLGYIKGSLHIVRTGEFDINKVVKEGIQYFLRGLGLTILCTVIIGLTALVACAPGFAALAAREEEVAVVLFIVGALLAMVITFPVFLRFQLSLMFLVDQDLEIMEAWRAAKQFSLGSRPAIIGTALVWCILGVPVACCTCGLASTPWMYGFFTILYLSMTGQFVAREQKVAAPAAPA